MKAEKLFWLLLLIPLLLGLLLKPAYSAENEDGTLLISAEVKGEHISGKLIASVHPTLKDTKFLFLKSLSAYDENNNNLEVSYEKPKAGIYTDLTVSFSIKLPQNWREITIKGEVGFCTKPSDPALSFSYAMTVASQKKCPSNEGSSTLSETEKIVNVEKLKPNHSLQINIEKKDYTSVSGKVIASGIEGEKVVIKDVWTSPTKYEVSLQDLPSQETQAAKSFVITLPADWKQVVIHAKSEYYYNNTLIDTKTESVTVNNDLPISVPVIDCPQYQPCPPDLSKVCPDGSTVTCKCVDGEPVKLPNGKICPGQPKIVCDECGLKGNKVEIVIDKSAATEVSGHIALIPVNSSITGKVDTVGVTPGPGGMNSFTTSKDKKSFTIILPNNWQWVLIYAKASFYSNGNLVETVEANKKVENTIAICQLVCLPGCTPSSTECKCICQDPGKVGIWAKKESENSVRGYAYAYSYQYKVRIDKIWGELTITSIIEPVVSAEEGEIQREALQSSGLAECVTGGVQRCILPPYRVSKPFRFANLPKGWKELKVYATASFLDLTTGKVIATKQATTTVKNTGFSCDIEVDCIEGCRFDKESCKCICPPKDNCECVKKALSKCKPQVKCPPGAKCLMIAPILDLQCVLQYFTANCPSFLSTYNAYEKECLDKCRIVYPAPEVPEDFIHPRPRDPLCISNCIENKLRALCLTPPPPVECNVELCKKFICDLPTVDYIVQGNEGDHKHKTPIPVLPVQCSACKRDICCPVCPPGSHCDLNSLKCVKDTPPPVGECERCVGDICVAFPCGECKECVNGRCVPIPNCKPPIPPPIPPPTECNADIDCGECGKCVAGKCKVISRCQILKPGERRCEEIYAQYKSLWQICKKQHDQAACDKAGKLCKELHDMKCKEAEKCKLIEVDRQ